MNKWTEFPSPLKKKILLASVIGIACLFVGISFCVIAKDIIMLLLSVAIFLFSAYKTVTLYQVVSKGEYEVVEGVCTSIAPKLFGKYRKIKIADEAKNERSLMIAKSSNIKVGDRCCFYFAKTKTMTIGNEQFDLPSFSDNLLGYELKSDKNTTY